MPTTHSGQLIDPFYTAVMELSHPSGLLRRLSLGSSDNGRGVTIVICQHSHLP